MEMVQASAGVRDNRRVLKLYVYILVLVLSKKMEGGALSQVLRFLKKLNQPSAFTFWSFVKVKVKGLHFQAKP